MQAQATMNMNSMNRYFALASSIDNLIVMIDYPLQNSPGQGAWSVLAATWRGWRGHYHQYPHSFNTIFTKICCDMPPQVIQQWEDGSPGPEGAREEPWQWG